MTAEESYRQLLDVVYLWGFPGMTILLIFILLYIAIKKQSYHEEIKNDYLLTKDKFNKDSVKIFEDLHKERLAKMEDFLNGYETKANTSISNILESAELLKNTTIVLTDTNEKLLEETLLLHKEIKKRDAVIDRKEQHIRKLLKKGQL